MAEEHLAVAKGHVTQGELHITRQREIIAQLQRDGHDVSKAKQLLNTYEASQALHIAHRDMIHRTDPR